MSNLASLILEGASVGYGGSLKHTYDHETGATLIAMESAEALRDIFEMTFYIPNSITIQEAAGNYVDYAVMEGVVGDVWEKIKKFFIDLKNKVMELLYNIKRYLLGIFGDTVKWVNQYEKDIMAIPDKQLDGYEVKMYEYTNIIESTEKASVDMDGIIKYASKFIAVMLNADDGINKADEEEIDGIKETAEESARERILGKRVDEEEIDEAIFAMYRNGAEDKNDMEDIKVGPNRRKFIDTLKKQNKIVSVYDSLASKIDTSYKKAIKYIDGVKKEIDKLKVEPGLYGAKTYQHEDKSDGTSANYRINGNKQANISRILSVFSSATSYAQGLSNKSINAGKAAMLERNGAYKKALMGCFAYARKNKDK